MQNTRVRNLFSTILGVGAITGSLVLSSCEDEFTEEDAIRAQQETLMALEAQEDSLSRVGAKIDYTVTVVAAGKDNTGSRTSGQASVDSASVTVTQGGMSITEKTGKGGVAVFTGLSRGKAIVTVDVADHTNVTYTTTLGSASDDYETKEANNVGTLIPVFPTTVEGGASLVRGKAWAELDATNDVPDAAEGATVRATIDVDTALKPYKSTSSGYGVVETATYEDFVRTATVDSLGNYELIIPNGNGSDGQGIGATVEFMPFVAKQKYNELQGGKLVEVEKEVLFDMNKSTKHIKDMPGVYMEIEAPTGKAEGFAVEAQLAKQPVIPNLEDMTSGGTGYVVGDVLEFPANEDGEKASFKVETIDGNGAITGVTMEIWKEYKEEPGAPTGGAGTGATFDFDFTPEYNIVVTNPGTGYWTEPEVNMVYTDGNSTKSKPVSINANITNGEVGEKGTVINVSVQESTTVPVLTVINPVAKQATVDPRMININSEGKVTNIYQKPFFSNYIQQLSEDYPNGGEPFDGGAGYMSSPKVTFKAVGSGAGATGIAVVADGKITDIVITNPGSGYDEANDTQHKELEEQEASQASNVNDNKTFKFIPGTTSNVGINHTYGSGAVQ